MLDVVLALLLLVSRPVTVPALLAAVVGHAALAAAVPGLGRLAHLALGLELRPRERHAEHRCLLQSSPGLGPSLGLGPGLGPSVSAPCLPRRKIGQKSLLTIFFCKYSQLGISIVINTNTSNLVSDNQFGCQIRGTPSLPQFIVVANRNVT